MLCYIMCHDRRRTIYEKSRIYTTLTTFVPIRSKQRQKQGKRINTTNGFNGETMEEGEDEKRKAPLCLSLSEMIA